jgi:FkbM family methyltransferase
VTTVPLSLKLLVPGYRDRWLRDCRALIDHINRLAPQMNFGDDADGPWLQLEDGPQFHGFETDPGKAEVHRIIAPAFQRPLPVERFRLVLDYINRYLYPHLRPDLRPEGYAESELFGFHGQQKDQLQVSPPKRRTALLELFRPKSGDVVVDCGPFLGFGEIRISPELLSGRVIAIEASAACHRRLTLNLERNKVPNVIALHRAVWNCETELDLSTGHAQANSAFSEIAPSETKQKVRTVTIDGVARDHGLERLDVLSLTLNGAEPEAIDGAHGVLTRLRPRIRAAGWYLRDGEPIWQHLTRRLEPYGYACFKGTRGGFLAFPTEMLEPDKS